MDFQVFKQAVAKQFEKLMATGQLFRTNTDKDALWATYLAAFPEGSNPVFRERTEHDCSCCRQFIKSVGNAVAFIDGHLVTVWDMQLNEPAYNTVAAAMATYVRASSICDVFLHDQKTAGTDRNFEEITGQVKTWDHFFVNLKPQYVAKGSDIPTKLGEARTTVQLFQRGLETITTDAVETVLDLIAQGTLYRGAEFKDLVSKFQTELQVYLNCNEAERTKFPWVRGLKVSPALARIRNSAIGTLLLNLSEGMDLEQAVKAWETVMAPTNYMRPTALVTPKMIEQAMAKIQELGLTSALERRYACLTDITVNNILFADRNAKRSIERADIFEEFFDEVSRKAPKKLDKVEEIGIADFIANVLPRISSMEVLLENKHSGNLMSLVAPVDPTAGSLFKWDNNFSWSYNGEVTDSIKERVKAAGGNVTGDLCCRLAWFNYDDLDLHLQLPRGQGEICFWDKKKAGGQLDVDMNAGSGRSREPVENIFFGSQSQMPEGEYHLFVQQYNQRETSNVGFEAQIDFMGQVWSMAYTQPVRGNVTIARFRYSRAKGFEMLSDLQGSKISKTVYGLPTETYHKVSTLLLSPNHWDDQVGIGNKHYFFMLDGAKADQPARGFYNEFLKESLTPHRKVFEIVGSKMKVADNPDQLSGLGFSSTQKASLIVRVSGSFTRTLQINF